MSATILKTPLFIWRVPMVTSFKSLQGSNFYFPKQINPLTHLIFDETL